MKGPELSINSLTYSSFDKLFPRITISGLNVIVAFDRLAFGAFLAIVRIVGNGLAVDQPKVAQGRFAVSSRSPMKLANAGRRSVVCAKEETR
jgi:hypothetical protein